MKCFFILSLILLCIPSAYADEVQTAPDQSKSNGRFISLAPHITELLFAVGAGKQIVGAVSFSDYPPEARDIPLVGSYNQINHEQIITLKPTIVFGWDSGNGEETLQRLRDLGLRVHSHEPRSLEDVAESLRVYGELTGNVEQGKRVSEDFLERLTGLRERYENRTPVRIFYQLWNEPQLTINGEHLISDVIRLCGGRNIFADAAPLVPKVGLETVLTRAPEIIIASGMAAERPAWLDDWKHWPSIPAVKEELLFSIHPDLLHRHSPRILDGAEQVCEILDQARKKRGL